MATKRDRKTAFPFIKPKGSIKKDVQQYRKEVMSQNGGETDQVTREAMINPVQRRESSASRFLKHFTRPDRSNPAYHSEGKGLRKRRNWNSERQLAAPPQQSVSSAPDPAVNSSGNNQPQRSHSFSEKPVDNHLPVSKENSGGVRESFRWRFSKSRSNNSSVTVVTAPVTSIESPPKGGDTVKKGSRPLPASGSQSQVDIPAPLPSSDVAPPTGEEGNQEHYKENQQQQHEPHNVNSPMRRSSSHAPVLQPWMSQSSGNLLSLGHSTAAPAGEPIYTNARAHHPAESDYVNYEVFASLLTQQTPHYAPDLIRNLPYQQQQQQIRGYQLAPQRRHSNHGGFGEVTDTLSSASPSHSSRQQLHPGSGIGGGVSLRPSSQRNVGGGPASTTTQPIRLHQYHQEPIQRAFGFSMQTSSNGYVGRPPAPLPMSSPELTDNEPRSMPSKYHMMPPWNGTNAGAEKWGRPNSRDEVELDKEEDETEYASQLRSSMAALLQATNSHPSQHIRQSSNSSSTYSSYSDEQQLGIPAMATAGYVPLSPSSSSPPPPPPPVRDASSLKYVKYGPGHEKHPSWPMPSTNQTGGANMTSTGSQRSKSWTEHTDYPKEPMAGYTRPGQNTSSSAAISAGGRTTGYSQQLKTVLESCESRIPPEVYQDPNPNHHRMLLDRSNSGGYLPLPAYDCDGRTIEDKDYAIPSPPERDISHHHHMSSPEAYGPRMSGPPGGSTEMLSNNGVGSSDYAKYEDIQQYSASNSSEGYSSYVPSESSYVSCLSGGGTGTPLLDQLRRMDPGDPSGNHQHSQSAGTRDSMASTVLTGHSGSSSGGSSSNETLRWHGSYSDLSSSGRRAVPVDPSVTADPAALVVHSAKVQPPQRHNSESVLYYEQQLTSGVKTINRQGGWSQRVERKNQWNAQQPTLPEEPASSEAGTVSTPLSVAERIHQLEWQSRSVPNLAARESPQRPTQLTEGSAVSTDPQASSRFTFLDPDKRMRVADPTLKAIQKQALLSYYERHAGRSSNGASSQALKSPPRSPSKNDGFVGQPQKSSPSPPSTPSPSSQHCSDNIQSLAVAAVVQQQQHHQVAEGQQPNNSRSVKETPPVPPERPPKKPHLRSNAAPPSVAVDQPPGGLVVTAMIPKSKKPPAPDPAAATLNQHPFKGGEQIVVNLSPTCSLRSDSPDLPLPPPPLAVCSADEETLLMQQQQVDGVDIDDAPLPPPPILPLMDDNTGRIQSPSPTSMYHKEPYAAHRKMTHNPVTSHNYYHGSYSTTSDSSTSPPASLLHYHTTNGKPVGSKLTGAVVSSSTEGLDDPRKYDSEVMFQTPQKSGSNHKTASEQFAYQRQVSEGRAYSHRTDPGLSTSILDRAQHQRSRSDSDKIAANDTFVASKVEIVSSSHPVKAPITTIPAAPRPKRPEELECDQLSQDLISHLLPTDSKLHALLSAPDPGHATATLRTEGLLQVQLGSDDAVSSSTVRAFMSTSPPRVTSPVVQSSPNSLNSSPKSSSCAPLPATSAYFTTSEPRAKLLTRYHSSHHIADESAQSGDNANGERVEQAADSELLIKKKEELVSRLARKLDVLRSEREAIQEEVESNELLGRTVTSRVAVVATPAETNKVFLHVAEVDKITALLLALAGRLARAQNALHSLPADSEHQEKTVLEGKRDKLVEQLEEAKKLKENIDRRSRRVSNLLSKYLTEEEFADYSHFVMMKTKLVIDQRELDEKIKLGDEQLAALRETLHLRPTPRV